jgi:hypothetical protein
MIPEQRGIQMDREIFHTTAVIVGDVPPAVQESLKQQNLESLVLADIAPGAVVEKLIPYAAGNFAGIFGHTAEGKKIIVNAHAALLGPDQAALLPEGKTFPGVYLVNEAFCAADAVAYLQERLAHFARAGEAMKAPRECTVGGTYSLDILRPKLKQLHKLEIWTENGTLVGTHTTENDSQPMQDLQFDGQYLTWNAYSGTTSSELFAYRLEVFDDVLLGATWRIDGDPKASHRSPVVVERLEKAAVKS